MWFTRFCNQCNPCLPWLVLKTISPHVYNLHNLFGDILKWRTIHNTGVIFGSRYTCTQYTRSVTIKFIGMQRRVRFIVHWHWHRTLTLRVVCVHTCTHCTHAHMDGRTLLNMHAQHIMHSIYSLHTLHSDTMKSCSICWSMIHVWPHHHPQIAYAKSPYKDF